MLFGQQIDRFLFQFKAQRFGTEFHCPTGWAHMERVQNELRHCGADNLFLESSSEFVTGSFAGLSETDDDRR